MKKITYEELKNKTHEKYVGNKFSRYTILNKFVFQALIDLINERLEELDGKNK